VTEDQQNLIAGATVAVIFAAVFIASVIASFWLGP
jgi:hypothetical protein